MSYTCGAATSDDISTTLTALGASGVSTFLAGWFKPTTLTAGRGLIGAGAVFGAEIDTTTSELRLRTDNTTDGQWTTTGVGLVVNQWQFIAILNTCTDTGPAAAWRVWSGTSETAPLDCPVTQAVAPVGAFAGSTAVTVGNKAAGGVLAFQGQVGTNLVVRCGTVGAISAMPIAAHGAISTDDATLVLNRFVLPIWKGNWCPFHLRNWPGDVTQMMYTPLDVELPIEYTLTATTGPGWGTIALSGVTFSQERPPRAMMMEPFHQPMQRMRR